MKQPMPPFTRRDTLASFATLAALLATPAGLKAAEETGLRFGEARPFSFEGLIERARQMAAEDYVPPPRPVPEITEQIDYDAHGKLRYKPEHALWAHGEGVYPVTFVHLGRYFQKSVRMSAVGSDGQAREILYDTAYFTMPEDHVAHQIPTDASAFAGFWVRESNRAGDWSAREPWATFVGASYFRTVGELGQVGMSARGIALNTGGDGPEEFPDFTEFYLEPTRSEGEPFVFSALLDGPSITGAYRFRMHRGVGVIVEVEKHLFLRADVERLGIAPLTSMYWYGEYPSTHSHDWRPEVHDSDGLALWNGAGERLWRPAINPPRIVISSFADENPRGFGLSQRDRNYDHYLDGVSYDRRPTCWIEPIGTWGKGAVQLVEIPTDDEIYDNLVAFWLAEQPAKAGDALTYRYRMHWLKDEPFFPVANLARAFATRIGRGGEPGKERPADVVKMVVEWDGEILKSIPWGVRPTVEASASRGELSLQRAEPIWYTDRWRSEFDLKFDGEDPVELRCFMSLEGQPITETWLFQLHPQVLAHR